MPKDAEEKCEVCKCSFRQDGDEKRCKAHLTTILTEDEKLKRGMEIEGIKKTLSAKEIQTIIDDGFDKQFEKIKKEVKKLLKTKTTTKKKIEKTETEDK